MKFQIGLPTHDGVEMDAAAIPGAATPAPIAIADAASAR